MGIIDRSALPDDPIAAARARFDAIDAYEATIRSFHDGKCDIVRYRYKQPGYVRMDFVTPHAGTVAVHDPQRWRALLWPFGSTMLPPLVLRPDNPLIVSPTGHRIDHSDIGAFLDYAKELQRDGDTEVLAPDGDGRQGATHVVVTGGCRTVANDVHRYDIWLDHATGLPTEVTSYTRDGDVIETVVIDDLELNPELPAALFNP